VQLSSMSTTFPQTSSTTASRTQPGPLPTSAAEGAEPGPVEVFATAGRHLRDWPGIPVAVAVAGPDQRLREALRSLRQTTQEGHSNLCATGGTHDQPRY